MKKAAVFNGKFDEFTSPPQRLGDKNHRILKNALAQLRSVLAGYTIGQKNISKYLSEMMNCLRDPRLPAQDFDVRSSSCFALLHADMMPRVRMSIRYNVLFSSGKGFEMIVPCIFLTSAFLVFVAASLFRFSFCIQRWRTTVDVSFACACAAVMPLRYGFFKPCSSRRPC